MINLLSFNFKILKYNYANPDLIPTIWVPSTDRSLLSHCGHK